MKVLLSYIREILHILSVPLSILEKNKKQFTNLKLIVMEAKQKETIIKTLVANLSNANNASRNLPIEKGDTFTFVLSEKLIQPQKSTINGVERDWDAIVDTEGNVMSVVQITRRRNGLPLSGTTEGERLQSFCSLFDENDTLKLRVTDVRHRQFENVDDSGKVTHSTSNYYVFKIE